MKLVYSGYPLERIVSDILERVVSDILERIVSDILERIVSDILERIVSDILGELPLTTNGNRYVLVVADYFTKCTECFAIPNMEVSRVAAKIVEEVIARFGVPAVVHSDQGPQYENTPPYHPQSDGMVKCFNRKLTTMLCAFVSDHHTDWDVHLPFIVMAYRSSVHETGITPNMMMFGREVATPLDLQYEMSSQIKETPSNKWVWGFQEGLENAHAFVRNKMNQSMIRQEHYYDCKSLIMVTKCMFISQEGNLGH
ncbi:protein NYNRIN-like [Ostrea edulis]|uniref:protein NYNRIN-like n=1 Tax=Ostrea edulis TaxID=37623 RepID=UPI0024AECCFE|nr:protein NYNRIN-like [Ostrea edulis]